MCSLRGVSGLEVSAEGASNVMCSWGRVCIGRMCRLAADTARDIFVGPRVGVGVSALGMRKITSTATTAYLCCADIFLSLAPLSESECNCPAERGFN